MSGPQLGTYQPPLISADTKKPAKKKSEDDFNLLDIDFDDYNNQSNHSSKLDQSEPEIREDLPDIPEKGFLKAKEPDTIRAQMGANDDINANSGNVNSNPARASLVNEDDLEENKANIVKQPNGWHKYLSVEYYKQYFDVTTEEVIVRVRKACVPFYKDTIFENGKVDLYGPVWVIITLNIAITVFGNLARFGEEEYQLQNFTKSVPLITVHFIAMTAFLSILVKISGTQQISKLTFKIMSIYGYSFTSFIPATFLYIIPSNQLKWLVLLVAAGVSVYFLFRELKRMVENSLEESKIKLAAGVILATHFVFILLMKWKYLG